MNDTPQVLLSHHLKTLRLPTFLREYDKVAKQCATEGVDHSRYLLRLAELELIDRERRMISASTVPQWLTPAAVVALAATIAKLAHWFWREVKTLHEARLADEKAQTAHREELLTNVLGALTESSDALSHAVAKLEERADAE